MKTTNDNVKTAQELAKPSIDLKVWFNPPGTNIFYRKGSPDHIQHLESELAKTQKLLARAMQVLNEHMIPGPVVSIETSLDLVEAQDN